MASVEIPIPMPLDVGAQGVLICEWHETSGRECPYKGAHIWQVIVCLLTVAGIYLVACLPIRLTVLGEPNRRLSRCPKANVE